MTTETNRLDPNVLRAIAPELAAKIDTDPKVIGVLRGLTDLAATFARQVDELRELVAEHAAQADNAVSEVRDDLHALALRFERHQSKALTRVVAGSPESAQDAPISHG